MGYSIGIYIFDQVEVLDLAGPYEVFTTASRVQRRLDDRVPEPFSVFTLAQHDVTIKARAGLTVLPDYTFTEHPAIDVLIVPGGEVSMELGKAEVSHWIQQMAQGAEITASVCTGAFLLAKAGLLDGRCITTHWEDIQDLKTFCPTAEIKTDVRWVDAGQIVTSAGISAGIDMCLHLVERLVSRGLAVRTARQLEFDW